jgi:lipopolysaccharide transport system permease protein
MRRAASDVTLIRPSRGWVPLRLAELWASRELLYFLVWRTVKARYKQTVLGAGWAIIQPVMTMAAFSLFFGKLARVPSEGVPYPIFAFTALVPWTFFANSLSLASNSLVEQERLLTRVYFPRLLLPLAAVTAGLVDFAIAFGVLTALMAYYGAVPGLAVLAAPLFVLLAITAALGAGLWLSALNVQYRDVRYVTPFLVQFWLFVTPVAYPGSLVPGRWQALYGLNPMAGVIEGFRCALLGLPQPPLALLAASAGTAVFLLISGLYYFRRMERSFADVV